MITYLRTLFFTAVILFSVSSAFADQLKGLFDNANKVSEDMAVLYLDSSSRLDLSIMAEFMQDCGKTKGVSCICAESSGAEDDYVINSFKGTVNESCIYRGTTTKASPRIEFYKGGSVVGAIEKNGNFAGLTGVYLKYITGDLDEAAFKKQLAKAETAQEYKKIIPRMKFVMMLAKKGQVASALKELDKMSAYNLDNKGKLMIGETYLRLKAPVKAISILSRCDDTDCHFYKGVAEYLADDLDMALETLTGLRDTYTDNNKLNFYLKKIYEAKGDMKHADAIRLPENYNINSD